ncbi:N-acetyltransferase [Brotaphodocola sp.]|uniref:N-acetyltransferase n=1 Tax=Brotaphodocola sp. TaxID=3073577 RepID=UPI003D7DB6A1
MIRVLKNTDINAVVDIWLDVNQKAHDFISAQYWKNNYDLVKEILPQAEVYVYEDDQKIQGFIGVSGEYIEGLFVCDGMQSQGTGKRLLDFIKDRRTKLCLNVYQKNTRAIHFYKREGFKIQSEGLDEATGKKDYVMIWQQK